MNDVQLLSRTVMRTATRHKGVLALVGWAAAAVVIAAARRGEGANEVVLGALGPFVIPLVAFAAAASALSGRSLRAVVEPLVLLGAPRSSASLAPFAVAMVSSAALCGVLGGLCVALAREPSAPFGDVLTTAWIAALGGASYAALFVATSSFGKAGGGRNVALAIDFVLGASGGLGGALTLRGHLRNLLGGAAPLRIGQRVSCVAIVIIAAVAIALALRFRTSLKLDTKRSIP